MSSSSQNENLIKSENVLKPFFPKATEILFYSGNTLASLKMLKKTNMSITEELIEYISMILQAMKSNFNEKQYRDETYVKLCPIQDANPSINSNGNQNDNEQLTREGLKFTVKIFLRSLDTKVLAQTIDTILSELKENYVESVMLSLPNYGSQLTLEEFLPLWRVIEDYIDNNKIINAGVCDFMLPLLSDFYNAAKHKPVANQINLNVCCTIPEELNQYVKENQIRLLTHSDPIDVINESDFQQTMREYCHEYDALNWKPASVVRYNSVIANRGIIKTKGFFVYAKRELRML